MDEPVPLHGAIPLRVPDRFQQILDETARVLAESPTLADAAPLMLGAVCRALDWQYGALWEVDRARNVLRPVGMWPPAPDAFREFEAVVLFRAQDTIEEVPVYLGERSKVPMVGGRDLVLTLPRQWRSRLQVRLRYDAPLTAPIARGQQIGEMMVSGQGVTPNEGDCG